MTIPKTTRRGGKPRKNKRNRGINTKQKCYMCGNLHGVYCPKVNQFKK